MSADYQKTHFALMDLTYTYLDDGFTIVATTDVPCHLYCRMSKQPPLKHVLPAYRRGLRMTGDVRFCFTVYEDNNQQEAGDTLQHTFIKDNWPVCEHRWFYFVGEIDGKTVVSETCIFEFHFPAPPPEPPPPMLKQLLNSDSNRTIRSRWGTWPPTRNGIGLTITHHYAPPSSYLTSGHYYTVTYSLHRSFLDFGVLTLPPTAKIVSAYLSIFVISNPNDMPAKPYLIVEEGLQSEPIIANDWFNQNPITTLFGQISRNDITVGQYNDIPFTQEGLDYLALAGNKKFCLLSQYDFENVAPFPLPGSEAYVNYHSNQKGAGWRPILKVYYYPA